MAEKPLLIGIAAPTSAGKTLLLRELGQRLSSTDIEILSFDEYDLYPSGSKALQQAVEQGTIVNWEDPALFDYERYFKDLQKLRDGEPITLLSRSRESMAGGVETRTIHPKGLTIVEGIFAFADERTAALFDRRFYIEIPTDIMVARRLKRTPEGSTDPWDDPDYIKTTMVEGTEYYIKPQRQRADVVLEGTRSTAELATQVIFDIRNLRKLSL